MKNYMIPVFAIALLGTAATAYTQSLTRPAGIVERLEALEVAMSRSIVVTDGPCDALGPNWVFYQGGAGRFLLGASSQYVVGADGGTAMVALEERHMPNHAHRQSWGQTAGAPNTVASGNNVANYPRAVMQQYTEPAGGGQEHENMPPYRAVNFCVLEAEN